MPGAFLGLSPECGLDAEASMQSSLGGLLQWAQTHRTLHDVPHLTELGSPPGEMEQSCCKDLKERMHATLGKGKTGSAQEGWEGQVRSEEILNTKMGWQPTPLMRAM